LTTKQSIVSKNIFPESPCMLLSIMSVYCEYVPFLRYYDIIRVDVHTQPATRNGHQPFL